MTSSCPCAVAAHGGNHEGLGSALLEEGNHLTDHHGQLIDSAATSGNRHRHARLNGGNHGRTRQLAARLGRHILKVGSVKNLANRRQSGNGHIFEQFMNGAHVSYLLQTIHNWRLKRRTESNVAASLLTRRGNVPISKRNTLSPSPAGADTADSHPCFPQPFCFVYNHFHNKKAIALWIILF